MPIQLNNIDPEGAEISVHIFTEHNGGELVLFMSSRSCWPSFRALALPSSLGRLHQGH